MDWMVENRKTIMTYKWGGGVKLGAHIVGCKIINSFKCDNSITINEENHYKFINNFFQLVQVITLLKSIFMQDDPLSHFAKMTITHLVKKT